MLEVKLARMMKETGFPCKLCDTPFYHCEKAAFVDFLFEDWSVLYDNHYCPFCVRWMLDQKIYIKDIFTLARTIAEIEHEYYMYVVRNFVDLPVESAWHNFTYNKCLDSFKVAIHGDHFLRTYPVFSECAKLLLDNDIEVNGCFEPANSPEYKTFWEIYRQACVDDLADNSSSDWSDTESTCSI